MKRIYQQPTVVMQELKTEDVLTTSVEGVVSARDWDAFFGIEQ